MYKHLLQHIIFTFTQKLNLLVREIEIIAEKRGKKREFMLDRIQFKCEHVNHNIIVT